MMVGLTFYSSMCTRCAWSLLALRKLHLTNPSFAKRVLGIETSCDDTGAAVVDENGKIHGEALNSQQAIHINHGGIIPPIARALHSQYISDVVHSALNNANCELKDIDAIATTVKPGLALSLAIGMKYGKKLAKEFCKPFIPIHHMEAHALTVRMLQRIDFPFLVLLVSGGHCLLAVVKGVDEFLTLGSTIDDAPGEAFDKTARRLKLKNLPQFTSVSGGQAIELLARDGNPQAYQFPQPMYKYRDCNFSFAGLKFTALKQIMREEKKHELGPVEILPNISDLCASFQHGVTVHLIKRVYRAMLFCEMENYFTDDKYLVVSGGVACNMYIRQALQWLCAKMSYEMVCPPPNLCTDNGIMIAWNGIERLQAGIGIAEDIDAVDIQARCPFGKDISRKVQEYNIKLPRLKLDFYEKR